METTQVVGLDREVGTTKLVCLECSEGMKLVAVCETDDGCGGAFDVQRVLERGAKAELQLAAAKTVLQVAIDWPHDLGTCLFCHPTFVERPEADESFVVHDDDCVLGIYLKEFPRGE